MTEEQQHEAHMQDIEAHAEYEHEAMINEQPLFFCHSPEQIIEDIIWYYKKQLSPEKTIKIFAPLIREWASLLNIKGYRYYKDNSECGFTIVFNDSKNTETKIAYTDTAEQADFLCKAANAFKYEER